MKYIVRFGEVMTIKIPRKPTVWTNLCGFVVFRPDMITVNKTLSLFGGEVLRWGTQRIISHMHVPLINITLTTKAVIETIYHSLCTPVQIHISMNGEQAMLDRVVI